MSAPGTGGTTFVLADRLAHPLPMPPPDVATVGAQLAKVLDAWHRGGQALRAVAPATVELHRDAGGVLHARLLGAEPGLPDPTGTGAVPDPRYLAPEQRSGRPVGPAADVFALGAVLLACLLGELPEPLAVPADLGAGWRYLLGGMTAPAAADRPTAEHVARTLAAVPGAVPTPPPRRANDGSPHSKLLPEGAHVEPRAVDVHRSPLTRWRPVRRDRGPDVRQ